MADKWQSKYDQDKDIKIKRPKKYDKAKEKFDRNGKYSTKHIRARMNIKET